MMRAAIDQKKKRSVAACEPKKLWEFAAGEALSVRGIGCSCSLGHFTCLAFLLQILQHTVGAVLGRSFVAVFLVVLFWLCGGFV